MAGLFKPYGLVAAGVLGLLLACLPVQAFAICGIIAMERTLTTEVDQASMVLYGVLANAKPGPQPGAPDGTTDLIIEEVIKSHPNLKSRDKITLPRFIGLGPDSGKYHLLVFIDVVKDKIDPYRGLAFKADSKIGDYLQGALKLKAQKPEKRLRYFFDYLENGDIAIGNDAYLEFDNADFKDYRNMAKSLPADGIAGWLKDPVTPGYRLGLYASLLGHCGKEEHGALLRKLLDERQHESGGWSYGMLAGYVMLKPKEGWNYVKGVLKDPHERFPHRYAALRATRFLWDFHPDLIGKKELAKALLPLLDMKDIADVVIEDFRKCGCWEFTDRILALQTSPVYQVKIVKRSILRFALTVKDNKAAAEYVAAQRALDPEWVGDVEELLKLDAAVAPPAATPRP